MCVSVHIHKCDANGVAVAQLDDGKANSFGFEMISRVNEFLDVAEGDVDTKSVVVAGNNKAFSAGFDLTVIKSGRRDDINSLVCQGADLCMRMYSFPKPLVVAATGHSLALGAILLLAADYRVGVDDSRIKIGLNEVAIGFPLPIFALELGRARIPSCMFSRATTHAEVTSPQSAVQFGFLDEVCAHDRVVQRACDVAARLGGYVQTPAYHLTKMKERGAVLSNISETLHEDIKHFSEHAVRFVAKQG